METMDKGKGNATGMGEETKFEANGRYLSKDNGLYFLGIRISKLLFLLFHYCVHPPVFFDFSETTLC